MKNAVIAAVRQQQQIPLLEMRGIEVRFPGLGGDATAVVGVDLEIQDGEFFGLIGETGAGKSQTAWAALRMVPPPGRLTSGEVWFKGQRLTDESEEELRRLRGKEIAVIVQNPRGALNPMLSIGQQLSNTARAHTRMKRSQARKVAIEAIQSVGLPDAAKLMEAYPHQLSGGMAQRVLIAMALIKRPRLLIADEPTTGLDVTIQADILDLLSDLMHAEGSAVWIITHDLGIIAHYTTRSAVMFAGEIIEMCSTPDLFSDPRHPYTIGLMQALDGDRARAGVLNVSGAAPNLQERLPGCQFAYRCPWAEDTCHKARPILDGVTPGHFVRCFVAQDKAGKAVEAPSATGTTAPHT